MPMREAYQEQLGEIATMLGDMCDSVAEAMSRATTALIEADLAGAEAVISGDAAIDRARATAEDHALSLLALQAPVAGDLRIVVSVLHIADHLERMGDLAVHVAKATRRRHPAPVLPDEVSGYLAEMGRVGVELTRKAAVVVRTGDIEVAQELEDDDDALDDLHRHLFSVMMGPEWAHGVATAVDMTLLGRFYERFGDHAVSVARRMVFVATGKMPDGVTTPGSPNATD